MNYIWTGVYISERIVLPNVTYADFRGWSIDNIFKCLSTVLSMARWLVGTTKEL